MKAHTLLSLFAVLSMSASAMATDIDFTTENHLYERYSDQVSGILYEDQRLLDNYLGNELECRLVRIDFNNIREPKLFKKGEYNFTLTAKCNKTFSDFDMEVTYGDLGEPWGLKVSYVLNGHKVEKTIHYQGSDD